MHCPAEEWVRPETTRFLNIAVITSVFGPKIFSGEASMWVVSIAAFAQGATTLGSPTSSGCSGVAQLVSNLSLCIV
jgi:hypothetical protein